jgi:hypothetical protein
MSKLFWYPGHTVELITYESSHSTRNKSEWWSALNKRNDSIRIKRTKIFYVLVRIIYQSLYQRHIVKRERGDINYWERRWLRRWAFLSKKGNNIPWPLRHVVPYPHACGFSYIASLLRERCQILMWLVETLKWSVRDQWQIRSCHMYSITGYNMSRE